jgi:hypothetical protein
MRENELRAGGWRNKQKSNKQKVNNEDNGRKKVKTERSKQSKEERLTFY